MYDHDQQPNEDEAGRAEAAQRLLQNRPVMDPSAVSKELGKGWIWTTTWAGAVGMAIGWLIFSLFQGMMGDIAAGAMVGAVVGVFQGRRLKTYLAGFDDGWWVLATSLAGACVGLIVWLPSSSSDFAFFLYRLHLPPYTDTAIAYASIGVLFGVAQWLVLRPYLPNSGLWILACVAATVVGGIFILLFLMSPLFFGGILLGYFYCFYIPANMLIGMIMGACAFLPAGVATGRVLTMLLNRSDQNTTPVMGRV